MSNLNQCPQEWLRHVFNLQSNVFSSGDLSLIFTQDELCILDGREKRIRHPFKLSGDASRVRFNGDGLTGTERFNQLWNQRPTFQRYGAAIEFEHSKDPLGPLWVWSIVELPNQEMDQRQAILVVRIFSIPHLQLSSEVSSLLDWIYESPSNVMWSGALRWIYGAQRWQRSAHRSTWNLDESQNLHPTLPALPT